MSTEEMEKYFALENSIKGLKKKIAQKQPKNKDVLMSALEEIKLRVDFLIENNFSLD